jgi:hypothetical protein
MVRRTMRFLKRKYQAKVKGSKVLKVSSVSVRRVGTRRAQIISIPQPKARWWMESESVPCFENEVNDTMCPVRLWEEYST